MAQDVVRTTVAVPGDLLARVDEAVRAGTARSRNEFVAEALRRELGARQREEIDAAFQAKGEDEDAQQEAAALAIEFSRADWEAFREGER